MTSCFMLDANQDYLLASVADYFNQCPVFLAISHLLRKCLVGHFGNSLNLFKFRTFRISLFIENPFFGISRIINLITHRIRNYFTKRQVRVIIMNTSITRFCHKKTTFVQITWSIQHSRFFRHVNWHLYFLSPCVPYLLSNIFY